MRLSKSEASNKMDKEVNKPTYHINISHINRALLYAFVVQFIFNMILILLIQCGIERFYGLGKFYFDREDSVPTYFSSIILLFAASLLAFIALLKAKSGDLFSKHWFILSVIFTCLSIDETAGFHESIVDPLRDLYNFTGFMRFPWVIAGLIFMIFFSVTYFKFLNSLPGLYKKGFIYSCLIYVTGAIGFEMVSAKLFSNLTTPYENLSYNLVITMEETFEMLGILLFISVLLSYIRSLTREISFTLK
ncbi:MAG: hypothetical protein ACYCZO_02065 [Daejeonella sp.]